MPNEHTLSSIISLIKSYPNATAMVVCLTVATLAYFKLKKQY